MSGRPLLLCASTAFAPATLAAQAAPAEPAGGNGVILICTLGNGPTVQHD
jgi:hypothetical protein